MEAVKRRKHNPEFKERSVKLARDLGNAAQAARELGIGYSLLCSWMKATETAASQGKSLTLALEEKAELQRLRKQVASQAQELAIIKKAVAYFSRGKREKYAWMEQMSGQFDVSEMCRIFDVSRSAYYAWRDKDPVPVDEVCEALKTRIRELFLESRCTYGFRSIGKDLGKEGLHVGKKRIRRLMREMNLVASPVLSRPYGSAKAAQEARLCKHRLQRNFSAKRPDRVWVGDITYIWSRDGWVYLAVVLDLFSRKVVGWSVSRKPDTSLVVDALAKAVRSRPYRRWRLMFHSDQGCQYTSMEFRQYLLDRGILQSMSRKGQCWDNAVPESFFGTMKRETGMGRWALGNAEEVREELFDWIEAWYNLKRRHSSLGYCSPVEFEIINVAA